MGRFATPSLLVLEFGRPIVVDSPLGKGLHTSLPTTETTFRKLRLTSRCPSLTSIGGLGSAVFVYR
jgi:hypothetical protein